MKKNSFIILINKKVKKSQTHFFTYLCESKYFHMDIFQLELCKIVIFISPFHGDVSDVVQPAERGPPSPRPSTHNFIRQKCPWYHYSKKERLSF